MIWLLGLHSVTLPAQSQPSTPEAAPRYFLFVAEASRSMKPRTQATLDVMQGLLNSAFDGQMRRGDILNAWAFNDALHKMGAPEQADSQQARATLSVRLLDFVMSQASDKKASLDKVLAELEPLLHDSPFVTVFLLSSGESEFHGSVCDGLINSSFKRLHDQQQQARKPLVTVIRSIAGQITECKVVAPGEAIKTPPIPGPAVVSAETKKAAVPVQTEPVKTASAAESQASPQRQPGPAPKPPDSVPSVKSPETAPAVNALTEAKVADPVESEKSKSSSGAPNAQSPVISPPQPPVAAMTAANAEKQVPAPAAVNDQNPNAPAQVEPSAPASRQVEPAPAANRAPEQTKPPSSELLGVSTPSIAPRSFLRENGKYVLVCVAAVFGAAFCFYNWLKTFAGRSGK